MCARAVTEAKIRSKSQQVAVAFHYYSFDNDDINSSNTYRNIATQLFHELVGPDDISDLLIDLTLSLDMEDALRTFIQILVMKSRQTYIFLDGIDEEKTPSKRWQDARGVLGFLVNLARQPDARLKIWVSSQDWPAIRGELGEFQGIVIDEATNSKDIEAFCEETLRVRLPSMFSAPITRVAASILSDLKAQVHGNFLWASMMVESISDAISIKDLRRKIKQGLPEDFEAYLSKQVRDLKGSPLVAKILSTLTYAKRPLSVEELSEVIAILELEPGEDLGDEDQVFEDKILYYYAPLTRVDEIIRDGVPVKICTLCHGSVKEFLLHNRRILTDTNL
ncbi:uncharacterized protein F4822DRAFT_291000 [Hypoxylon trugodes]|uniref:uncharacterized protein n=1 Tax=Hypoxylon trugodes TaxID=326681 RepID=UPI0021A09591|nr:uncharacterized protein F4822DRAFT_291000 [Hypoxylon trugodes]KAI1387722.1 hypothetical protein F4822DRAFT_291000 [Hypoxylon trugodes]